MKFPSPGGAVYNMGHPCCLCATFSVYPSCKHLTWYVVGIITHELELSQKLEVVVYLGHPVLLSSLCSPNIIEIYLVVCGLYQYTPTRVAVYIWPGVGDGCVYGPPCVACVCALLSPRHLVRTVQRHRRLKQKRPRTQRSGPFKGPSHTS